MLSNYLKIAWRSLQKQRMYGFINVLGLAIGVACCILISLFIWNELSYDKFNKNAEHIYRVHSDINFGGKREIYAVAQAPLAQALREEIPGVATACRFRTWGSWLVRREGTTQNVNEDRVVWAEHEVFDVFTFPLLAGDSNEQLKEPNTFVISASAARRHFGEVNPLGQHLIFDNDATYQVTGVFEDIPTASHFHYDFMLSMAGLEEARSTVWLSHNFQTYLVAKADHDPQKIEADINTMWRKYAGPQVREFIGSTVEEIEAQGSWARYTLMPLTDIHLHSSLIAEHELNSEISYVWIFGAIALFILFIACINFMNLATARSANRAKEVGMRKVLGSMQKNLVAQFLTEAMVMSIIAFVLALVFSEIAMPYFNQLSGKELAIPFRQPVFIGTLLVGALFTGLLAGSYPAFYLSSFRPIEVLKGKLQASLRTGWLRNALVIFQFIVSVLLIIGTIVIYDQLNFILNKRLGFNKEQVFLLYDTYGLEEKFQGFKNTIEATPEVKSLTTSCYLPVRSCRSDETVMQEGKSADQHSVNMQCWQVDYDYLKTLGIEMKEGRFFSKEFITDSLAVILNETAVKKFGYEDPLGQRLWRYASQDLKTTITYTVIGVVKDFHFESLHNDIGALGFFLEKDATGMMAIRFEAATTGPFLEKMKSAWAQFSPGQPFNYAFLDERFSQMYDAEQRLGSVFIVFAAIAIFIACLGLLALAAFTAEQRTKEIGIRKVLGATAAGIMSLLVKDFLKLVLVALLIASPLAWYVMNKWLSDFAYRVDISWWVFGLAGAIAVMVAFFMVSFQSIRAAHANPVESLRSE
ncbi:MAG TPA: ABC transporter permease [Saprospiraceae bacterium]|nr:ABC transporter permease [Saprospiraceae bacterium]